VKSAPPPSAPNDIWDSSRRAYGHRNGAVPSAVAESAARFESDRDRGSEAHRPARLGRIDDEERMGLFLAGALLAVLAWGAMGSAPRSAAVIVAVFAGAFMVAALAGSFRRLRNPRIARVIDAAPPRELRHANAALGVTPGIDRSRAPIAVSHPTASSNETRLGVGTSSEHLGRSAYGGLADE
jgi:hypothetical protein